MASSKKLPNDKTEIQLPTCTALIRIPNIFPQQVYLIEKPSRNFKVAFLGQKGSGRNSLAWRMNNLNNSELPDLPSLSRRDIILETSTRPALRHEGLVGLQIRIVPPEDHDGETFFDLYGEINECDAVVFVVDLSDDRSAHEFYHLLRKVLDYTRIGIPPFLIVGNKVDLGVFRVPRAWGVNKARLYSARGYLECSAKSNYRVGNLLDAILSILL